MITPRTPQQKSPWTRGFFEQIIKVQDKGKPEEKEKMDAKGAMARQGLCFYRTDTPDRSVNIRAAMFIEASS